MTYFEMSLINGFDDRKTFDISVNEELYNYFTWHDNAHSMGEDWFDITLNQTNVDTIKKLCKTDEEKELIAPNIRDGTIVDILIHRTILIRDD